ncbi:ABC transporter permease [Dickeya zeae]|nr:ABC transporter permease [Dickeya zeae]
MNINVSTFLRELCSRFDVLSQLISQQLILRYRRTSLGFLWTLINPLLMMSVMSLVFSTLFKSDLKTFAIFLFSGMIPWNFFNSVVTQSGTAFINNEGLIKKIYLPKIIFPLSISCALVIDSVLSFFALFFIVIAIGGTFSWAILFIPVAFFLLFLFSLGVGLIMSIATLFFRDLQYVILIVMQGLFFLTPIIYKHDAFGGYIGFFIKLNPIVPFIELFRAPLCQAMLPSPMFILQSVVISFAAMIIGLFVFLYQEKNIVFRL